MKAYTVNMKYGGELTGVLSMRERYPDGTRALILGDGRDGEILSINLAAYRELPQPDEDHVYVKNYSEHEGLPDALVAAGIVEKIREVRIGFGSGWLCKVIAEVVK